MGNTLQALSLGIHLIPAVVIVWINWPIQLCTDVEPDGWGYPLQNWAQSICSFGDSQFSFMAQELQTIYQVLMCFRIWI